jgi:hypothetical protein
MNLATLASHLTHWQSPEGAFSSIIAFPDRQEVDWNGFLTALLLREMRHLPPQPVLNTIRNQALNYLERCASPHRPGAFGFWPANARPPWASQVIEDSDDTAIMALELARYGRLTHQDLRRIICKVFLPHRLRCHDKGYPPWIQSGVFLTWLSADPANPNVVDCCVNVNVLALMAYAGCSHLPGFQQAINMIELGISWADNSPPKLAMLTPFYPQTQEFYWALNHAVECGVQFSERSIEALTQCLQDHDIDLDWPVCSSAYHLVVWRCPALSTIRRFLTAREIRSPRKIGDTF